MAKRKSKEEEPPFCPVGRFFADLERTAGRHSEFFEHLNKSRVEFLHAIKYLVDESIEILEKKAPKQKKKNMTKIEVE
jgi:hypothetical protein